MLNPTIPSGGLEGFAVLVTGGGTGIGRACAQQLAADGAAVTICGRTESKLLEAAEPIASTANHGGSVQIIVGDVTNEDDVKAFKADVEEMMRNCADEMGPQNIRYNAIRPGFIATEVMGSIPHDSNIYKSYIDNTPLGGVGQPEDVGQLGRFLIGNESRWITGQCINCDGGHALRRGPDFSQSVQAKFGADVLAGKLPA